jgi:hypothetical protein
MIAATLTVTQRVTEITESFDPGHRKPLAQALSRLINAQAAVKKSCVNVFSAAVAAALAAAAAAAEAATEALAAAVTSGAPPRVLHFTPGASPLAVPLGGWIR